VSGGNGDWQFCEYALSQRTLNVEVYIENAVHWNDIIAVDELSQLPGACILHVVGRYHILTAHEFRLDKSPG
jgi:hypothetical protein